MDSARRQLQSLTAEFWVAARHSPNIVPNCGQGELGPVDSLVRVAIFVRDRAGAAIGAAQAVQTNDKKLANIERLAGTTEQGAPPVANICTAAQGMADHKHIVSGGG